MKRAKKKLTRVYNGFFKVDKTSEGMEIVRASNAIVIMLYNSDQDKVVFIRQRRPPMVSKSNPTGEILEMVAGRFDCDLDPISLAIKEAKEEAGINLKFENVTLLNYREPLATTPGLTDEKIYLAMGTFTDADMDPDGVFGVAEEGEVITRELVSVGMLESMSFDSMTTYALVHRFLLERTSNRLSKLAWEHRERRAYK